MTLDPDIRTDIRFRPRREVARRGMATDFQAEHRERGQQHLAALFPESYQPPTRPTTAIAAVDVPDRCPETR